MNVKNGNLLVYKNGRWLIGSGGTVYSVIIPAAGSENMYYWRLDPASNQYRFMTGATWMTVDLFLELKSKNAALATDHNLTLYQANGALVLTLDSLPEQESVLYIVVPTMTNGGTLQGATPI